MNPFAPVIRESIFLQTLPDRHAVDAKAVYALLLDRRSCFFLRNKGSVQAVHTRGTRGQIEHVAASQQRFGAVGVENGTRIHLRRNAERNASRKVSLDEAGNDIDRWPLRGEHKVNADCARHLGQAGDRFLDIVAVEHHQVGQFVDDYDNVGNRAVLGLLGGKQAGRIVEQGVVAGNVADAFRGQQLQAALHLAHGIAQRIGRQFGLGDDGRIEMGTPS